MSLTLRERRDQLSLTWFYGLFFLLPLTVVFGHRGVAPWLLLASLPAFVRGDFWQAGFGGLFDGTDWRTPTMRAVVCVLLFCVWILVSGLWSPQHHYGLIGFVLAPFAVGASVVWFSLNIDRLWVFRLASAFAISIAVGMAVLAIEGVTHGSMRGFVSPVDDAFQRARNDISLGRGVTALAPALFPAAIIFAMIWGRASALMLLGLGVVAAISNDVSANVVAIGLGLVVVVASFKAPRMMLYTMQAIFLAALVLAPALALLPVEAIFAAMGENAPYGLSSSLHRLAIWNHVGDHLPAHMPFGAGADFARSWKESVDAIMVPGSPRPLSLLPLHPHNIFLQIWLELGIPGVALSAGMIWFAGRAFLIADAPKPIIAAIVGASAAVVLSFSTEASLWQVWRLAAIGVAGMGVALALKLHQYGWRDDH